ncbi:hypothetical protein QFZ70_000745 [Arthrobacter sp. V1I9]|nr:hypothetical protein [Arthrobacter sp. V1I9]
MLAQLVSTDHAHHRPITGDSDAAEQVKVLARSHQSLMWARQRQVNVLRSNLREYFPAALDRQSGSSRFVGKWIPVMSVMPPSGRHFSRE